MAECYPQGCPPCTEEISFPENPINGQRECFHIGKDPNTGEDILKCWVYDQCVPGWRAEGPTVAPIQFKGGVDLTKTEAGNDITVKEAGDYYIVNNGSADVLNPDGSVNETAQQFLNDNWFDLQHPILEGAFILWSGTEWIEIPRPCAEGCTQADWLETEEDECSFIKNKPAIPDAVGNIEGGSMTITVDVAPKFCSGSNLTVSAEVEPKSADGANVLGFFEYTWQGSNDGTNWTNRAVLRMDGATNLRSSSYTVENYTGDPAQLRVQVKFTDLYGNELVVVSDPIVPVAGITASITTQPTSSDLSSSTSGSIFVADDAPTDGKVYRWFVNNSLVQGTNNPDLGYQFSDWTTSQLNITRTDAQAGTYSVHVEIENSSDCNPLLVSDTVQLKGPVAETIVPTPPSTDYGAIGTYSITTIDSAQSGYIEGQTITITGSSIFFNLPAGTWRCMGQISIGQDNRPYQIAQLVQLWVRIG